MPRYVLLEHDYPVLHWDLLLEDGDALRTWRLTRPPQPDQEVTALLLANHRLMYLNYEGPLSGNRGTVSRWDAGTFTCPLDEADRVVADLRGGRLQGTVMLRRIREDEWMLTFDAMK